MHSSAQSKPDDWSIGTSVPPTPCLSRHYQVYLERRGIILSQKAQVLDSRDIATQWFNKPARGLHYQSPCSVVTDDHGYRRVREYLGRIEYGVY
ncbi:antitoxin Xre/MbcA/ParS toxin-binding domain-containing protein [Pseudomonas fitomaticsae]